MGGCPSVSRCGLGNPFILTLQVTALLKPYLAKILIDDRLAYLVNEGVIHRVQRGVFVPAQTHRTARYVTRSLLPDGTTVLEVGDTVLVLTPREARMVGELMAGAAQQYSAIEVGHQSAQLNGRLAGELRDLRREVRKLIEAN